MKKCKYCKARYRINYPFGKLSKPVITMLDEHSKDCKNNEKKERDMQ